MEEQKFSLTVYHADQCGNPQNCLYPHEGITTTAEELKPLLCYDHVFIQFNGNYRSIDNFVRATTATFDCDNDHSDELSEWIRPEDMPDIFPGVR